jgi:hypothetical protein
VGFFFEAFYRTGIWYRFVGVCQILAALMLLLPGTAALGAMLYLVIIVNIFLITVGVGFTGTPFITGPMVLAALYLVCWDYPRWKGLLFGHITTALPVEAPPRAIGALRLIGLVAAAAFGVLGVLITVLAMNNGRHAVPQPAQICLVAAVAFAVVSLADRGRRSCAGRPEASSSTLS